MAERWAQVARLWERIRERVLTAPAPVAPPGSTVRVTVSNPADGGFFYWLGKLYGFAALMGILLLFATGIGVYGHFSRATPPPPDLKRYADVVPAVTRVYAADGTLLGDFAEEWREVVAYDRIPEKLVHAFLAAEDHEFFEHGGLYVKGILRAAWRNITAGDFVQGGSTITQQVAKQFLGAEKTLTRKAREAIMARRLEARYSKEEILSAYLNHIYLGSGAYGVQAAARRYFSKNVWELDLGEMATIAGLAQAPSRDSPLANPENARRRRDEVLDKMVRYGFLDQAEADAARAEPIRLDPHEDVFLDTSPYFAEHVRRSLVERYGRDALMKDGLHVETTVWPWIDGVAYENVDYMTRKQDKRQGWRGPEAHLEGAAADTFLERQKALYGDGPLDENRRYLALVEKVTVNGATVRIGERTYRIPLANMDWASPWSAEVFENDIKIEDARQALRAGDVVWVRPPPTSRREFSDWTYDERLNPRWLPARDEIAVREGELLLEQRPHVQGAIFTFDHETGYVMAMVGGRDYAESEFNRVTQACRQPGSTYKPIYYSLALDEGYSYDTLLNDKPKAEVDPVTGEVWVPVNFQGTVDYEVTLEYALVFSKNVPSVDIFTKLGGKKVEAWARRLGFTSPIIPDKALALGASCTYTDELSRAFALFARNGRGLDLVYIRRVVDRKGNVLEDNSVYYDGVLGPRARLDRLAATAGERPPQVISPRTAFLTTKLLSEVVTHGYSGPLRRTGVVAAGKTGTSSATMDLWFVAFTSRWLTTTWLGDDLRERPLGKNDAAYMAAVPMWARYMAEATRGQPLADAIPWEVPPGVSKNDRGDGRLGETAPEPMPLIKHSKESVEEVPEGMPVRERTAPGQTG